MPSTEPLEGYRMDIIFFRLTLIAYLTATAGFLFYIIKKSRPAGSWSQRILLVGFVFNTIFLALAYYRLGAVPALTFRSSLSVFSWTIIAAYIIFQMRFKIMVLGSFVVPFSAFLMIISSTIPISTITVRPIFKSIWLPLHVAVSLLGNGIFAIAFIAGIMYLIQEHQIKTKRLGALYSRLPSLNVLDLINYHAISYGFLLLTTGMITGSVVAQGAHGSYWRWDPKEVWSLITWLCYAALLHQRMAIGWRGRRSALMSIGCFFIVIFTFVGVNFLMEGYHSFESLRGNQLP
jgi:cytochrome c-type biogenesis protein CcsB